MPFQPDANFAKYKTMTDDELRTELETVMAKGRAVCERLKGDCSHEETMDYVVERLQWVGHVIAIQQEMEYKRRVAAGEEEGYDEVDGSERARPDSSAAADGSQASGFWMGGVRHNSADGSPLGLSANGREAESCFPIVEILVEEPIIEEVKQDDVSFPESSSAISDDSRRSKPQEFLSHSSTSPNFVTSSIKSHSADPVFAPLAQAPAVPIGKTDTREYRTEMHYIESEGRHALRGPVLSSQPSGVALKATRILEPKKLEPPTPSPKQSKFLLPIAVLGGVTLMLTSPFALWGLWKLFRSKMKEKGNELDSKARVHARHWQVSH